MAVYNHFRRLQNKRQHMQRAAAAAGAPPPGAAPNLLVRALTLLLIRLLPPIYCTTSQPIVYALQQRGHPDGGYVESLLFYKPLNFF